MRPSGVIPDWASTGTQTEPGDLGAGGIVPKTANAGIRNWIYARLRAWKLYRDGFEAMSFDANEAPTQGESGSWADGPSFVPADRGPHMIYDPDRFLFVTGSSRSDDPTKAIVAMGYNAFDPAAAPFPDELTSDGDGAHTADFYVVLGKETLELSPFDWPSGVRSHVYVASLNVRQVATGGAYAPQIEDHDYADIRLWRGGGWTVTGNTPNVPAAFLRIGTLMYDEEDDRFYLFGTTTGGAVIIQGLKFEVGGSPEASYEAYEIRADAEVTTDCPRFCATTVGSKLMSNGVTIFRSPNRFTPWHAWPVSSLMKGETEILGLFRAETDGVFVAITTNGVWTSPNGVVWAKTPAPAGTYTGAGAALGGVSAVVYKDSEGAYRIGVATNSFRTWASVNCPFRKTPGPSGEDPVRQIFTLDNRLFIVSHDDKLAASLRL
jgi:hypothetical protein